MSTIFMSPEWFLNISVFFEIFFFAISLAISIYAFKVYKRTGQELSMYFGYGFSLMSAAYLLEAVSNFIVLSNLGMLTSAAYMNSLTLFDVIATYAYILLMISGIVFLLFVSFKSQKKRTLWLFLIISAIAIMYSRNPIYVFFLLSSIYLAFISWHFIENYIKNRKTITLSVALAFIFLWFGTFHFLISVNHQLFYVIGHVLDFFAFIMILLNFYLVRK